ncbi:hypothetical protein MPDQ_006579 [Monascus purpureus]|uniref:Uncharacterized protein n=1 Tax=Monascus purpureus TaxID=5098 RepID=A0A507R2A6_MONPU|nr:hypothetical protein MPDQ_006579 [Monascus purpureus]
MPTKLMNAVECSLLKLEGCMQRAKTLVKRRQNNTDAVIDTETTRGENLSSSETTINRSTSTSAISNNNTNTSSNSNNNYNTYCTVNNNSCTPSCGLSIGTHSIKNSPHKSNVNTGSKINSTEQSFIENNPRHPGKFNIPNRCCVICSKPIGHHSFDPKKKCNTIVCSSCIAEVLLLTPKEGLEDNNGNNNNGSGRSRTCDCKINNTRKSSAGMSTSPTKDDNNDNSDVVLQTVPVSVAATKTVKENNTHSPCAAEIIDGDNDVEIYEDASEESQSDCNDSDNEGSDSDMGPLCADTDSEGNYDSDGSDIGPLYRDDDDSYNDKVEYGTSPAYCLSPCPRRPGPQWVADENIILKNDDNNNFTYRKRQIKREKHYVARFYKMPNYIL